MKSLYRHKQSGDLFAIETDETGKIIGTCGPLFGRDFDPKMLAYDEYWNREVQAKIADFEQISNEDYLDLLRKNGFVSQSSQRWLW